MNCCLNIDAHQPIVARDGRPFGIGQGLRMKSLDWPYPSTTAGAVRTVIGKRAGGDFDKLTAQLTGIAVHGPLPVCDGELYVPIPRDAVQRPDGCVFAGRPSFRPDEGWDLADDAVRPVLLPDEAGDFKPTRIDPFWSLSLTEKWLCHAGASGFGFDPHQAILAVHKEERSHVAIDPSSGANREGMLYTTSALAFEEGVSMVVRVSCDNGLSGCLTDLDVLHPVGGERRLAHLTLREDDVFRCPESVRKAAGATPLLRMQLATPAVFAGGWLPGWLADGAPPFARDLGVKLTLRGVCIDRWRAVSGWSLEISSRGAKAIRRLVPAGGVYFFEAGGDGNHADFVEKAWLQPVCDDQQACRDGFGLALWGVWEQGE